MYLQDLKTVEYLNGLIMMPKDSNNHHSEPGKLPMPKDSDDHHSEPGEPPMPTATSSLSIEAPEALNSPTAPDILQVSGCDFTGARMASPKLPPSNHPMAVTTPLSMPDLHMFDFSAMPVAGIICDPPFEDMTFNFEHDFGLGFYNANLGSKDMTGDDLGSLLASSEGEWNRSFNLDLLAFGSPTDLHITSCSSEAPLPPSTSSSHSGMTLEDFQSISLVPGKQGNLTAPFLFPQGTASLAPVVGGGSTDGIQSTPQPQAGLTPQSGMINDTGQPPVPATVVHLMTAPALHPTPDNFSDNLTAAVPLPPTSDKPAGAPNEAEEQCIVTPDALMAPKNTKRRQAMGGKRKQNGCQEYKQGSEGSTVNIPVIKKANTKKAELLGPVHTSRRSRTQRNIKQILTIFTQASRRWIHQ